MKDILLKILYYLGLSVAGIIILFAIGLYLLPFTTPYLQHYHNEIATLASNLIRSPLKVSAISIDRDGVDPEIHLHNVAIYNSDATREIARFSDIYVGVSLFKSLLNKRLETNLLLISGARLDLYQDQNSSKHKIPLQVENILLSLFLTKQIALQDISVTWHAKDGSTIICPNLELDIKNRLLEHQIVGQGSLENTNPSWFKFIINLYGYDFHSNRTRVTGYVKFIQENKAAVNLWFTWDKQKLQSLQSQFVLHNFIFKPNPHTDIYLNYVAGNVLLRPEHDFWSLIGDYHNLNINYNNLFRNSLKIDNLQSIFSWRHTKQGWKIIASNLSARNQDLAINADAQMFLPAKKTKPRLDMLADFQVNNIANVKNYYPTQILPKGLITWLDTAIVNGKNISGTMVIRHNSRILVNSILHDMQLKFDPDWPTIDHITGNMIFDNKTMRINANGKTLNMPMDNIYIRIPNLEKPILTAIGNISGDNKDALNYINKSPLQHTVGKYFAQTRVRGPMKLRLKVTVPLADEPGNIDTSGKIIEHQGMLKVPSWHINLTNITGNIYFHDDAIKATGLKATLFNGPITMDVNTLKSNTKYPITRINGHGQASVDAIKEQMYTPILAQLSGDFNYRARLSLYSNPQHVSNFNLVSSLEGVKIDLPPPLTKTKEQLQSLYVNTTFGGREPMQVKLRCGENLSAALKFTKDKERLEFLNGAVNFGPGMAVFQDQPGLLITGYLPKINWADWRPYLTTQTSNRQTSIRKVILDIGQLDAYEQDLPNAKIQAIPEANAWQLYIDSSNINGQLTIPYMFPHQTLVGKFNRLYLTTKSKKFSSLQPEDVPPLHIISNDFRFAGKRYGYMELNVTPKNNNLRINKLAFNTPLYNMSATGEWQIIKGKPDSALYGTLQIKDAGALLKNAYNTNNLVGGKGNATFSLHWQDNIYQPNLSSMQGTVSLYLQQGCIVNLSKATQEKIGLGQMLNILSLQALPQHLTLNFSDLTKKGYYFNEMRGDYKLTNGDIYTYDTTLNGTVARITAQGRIGLIAKNCDLLLTMVPNVTSSLPVLATIVGGPVVGAVTFVGDEIFKHTLQPAMAYKYKITGPWANPKVVRLNVQKGTQKKA